MNNVLEIQNLTKKFGSFTAVNDISFSVEKGNIYGLLGPNGSGKSTTLGLLLNILNPTAGSWKWFNQEPGDHSLKRIGAIIESPKFYPYLSAQKNLEIVADIKEVSYDKIDEKSNKFDIDKLNKNITDENKNILWWYAATIGNCSSDS